MAGLVQNKNETFSSLLPQDIPLLRRQDLEIGKLLGRGRYSEVYAVKTLGNEDDNNYVMKHLQKKLFGNRTHRRFAKDLTNALADLVVEAMYLSKLRHHPHIIRLRGLTLGGTSVLKQSGAVAEDYFLVLDRMTETLDHRIAMTWRKQSMTQRRSLLLTKIRYAWQLSSALAYIHSHQIIYRDCKPENIGFQTRTAGGDSLTLFDMGLARELEEPPTLEEGKVGRLYVLSASGTRRYMAPEIFNGNGRYNYKADVYSFAIVVYEMLSLVKPFADFTCQSHEELVCRLGGRPRLSEICWPEDEHSQTMAHDLKCLLLQAWNQDLQERPHMARVRDRLQEILIEQGVSVEEGATSEIVPDSMIEKAEEILSTVDLLFLKRKTSTSELTVSTTDPLASDSELDDEQQPKSRWSHSSSSRTSLSSLGATPLK